MKVLECYFARTTSGQWNVRVLFDRPLQSSSKQEITALGRRVLRLMPKLRASQGASLIGSTATLFDCKESAAQLAKIFEGSYVWNSKYKIYSAHSKVVMQGSLAFIVEDILRIDAIEGVKSVNWQGNDHTIIEIKLDKSVDSSKVIQIIDDWMKL